MRIKRKTPFEKWANERTVLACMQDSRLFDGLPDSDLCARTGLSRLQVRRARRRLVHIGMLPIAA